MNANNRLLIPEATAETGKTTAAGHASEKEVTQEGIVLSLAVSLVDWRLICQ